jgi:hypothetical protein
MDQFLLWATRPAFADERGRSEKKWVATWTTAPQDVFQGSSSPALVNFAFPNPTSEGANNQTLRMIVKPDLLGEYDPPALLQYLGNPARHFRPSHGWPPGLFGKHFTRDEHSGYFLWPSVRDHSGRAGDI